MNWVCDGIWSVPRWHFVLRMASSSRGWPTGLVAGSIMGTAHMILISPLAYRTVRRTGSPFTGQTLSATSRLSFLSSNGWWILKGEWAHTGSIVHDCRVSGTCWKFVAIFSYCPHKGWPGGKGVVESGFGLDHGWNCLQETFIHSIGTNLNTRLDNLQSAMDPQGALPLPT